MRLAFAAVALALTMASPAAADVVLVHPPAADAFIEELFHRLAGELRVHAIATEEREGTEEEATEPMATALLGQTSVDACIFVSWRGDASVVRIWVGKGGSPPPVLLEAASLQRTSDVPTMLAARAVDLLSAALKAKSAVEPAPVLPAPDIPPVPPPHPPGPWSGEAGVGAFGLLSRVSVAGGIQVRLTRDLAPRFRAAVWLAGPLLGDRVENSVASARIIEGVGLLEIEAAFLVARPLTLSALGGLGGYFIHAEGTAAPGVSSVKSGQDSQLLAAGSLGIAASVSVTSRLSFVLSARALGLLPPARVAVGREDLDFAEPWLALALGLQFRF